MDINPNYCKCGSKIVYSDEYDTYYCDTCNEWLESKCVDPTCEFCVNRPATPLGDKNGNT
jgi:methionyl-tRNA synthetase